MTPQLQEQIELLDRKVEPFISRSNAVADVIAVLRDTIVLMARGEEVVVATAEVTATDGGSAAAETSEPEATEETATKKSRKS